MKGRTKNKVVNFKKLIEKARKKNMIKPHTAAFKSFSVNKENHKGKINYN